jgi:hypothetical protein
MKDILIGTWFGHALHPVLTDLPIGAWNCTMVRPMVLFVMQILQWLWLIVGATTAAVTGVTDWCDLAQSTRSVQFVRTWEVHLMRAHVKSGSNLPQACSRFLVNNRAVLNVPVVYGQLTFALRIRQGKIELRRLDHA